VPLILESLHRFAVDQCDPGSSRRREIISGESGAAEFDGCFFAPSYSTDPENRSCFRRVVAVERRKMLRVNGEHDANEARNSRRNSLHIQ
jgi:hypothetical protein